MFLSIGDWTPPRTEFTQSFTCALAMQLRPGSHVLQRRGTVAFLGLVLGGPGSGPGERGEGVTLSTAVSTEGLACVW